LRADTVVKRARQQHVGRALQWVRIKLLDRGPDWANDRRIINILAGTTLKKLVCLSVILLLVGCIPIGLKSSSLPFASIVRAPPGM
jgi:hypothetical protein